MLRKPIFVGFSDAEIRMRGIHLRKRVGETIALNAKFLSANMTLRGVVVFVREDPHGTLLILRNSHKGDDRYHCSGWTYIPIWLGCGQNGVIAYWKDTDSASHLEAQRAIDEFDVMCLTRMREQEVMRALAL